MFVRECSGLERGSVISEMAVILPLLVLLLFGTFEIGRLLAQYSWIQQTSYNAAFLGSGLTDNNFSTGPAATGAQKDYNKVNSLKNAMAAPNIGATFDPIGNTVAVQIQGQMNLLSKMFPMDVNVTSTGPSSILNYNPGNLSNFENNGSTEQYDCDGQPCTVGSCPTTCP